MNRRAFFRKTVGLFATAAVAPLVVADWPVFAPDYDVVWQEVSVAEMQKMYNFYHSAVIEATALAPRAPWIECAP